MEVNIPKQQKLTNWEKTYLWLGSIFIISALCSFIIRLVLHRTWETWCVFPQYGINIIINQTDLMIPYICINLIICMGLFDLFGKKLVALNVRRRYVGFLILITHLFIMGIITYIPFPKNMMDTMMQLGRFEAHLLTTWIIIMPFDLIGTYVIKPLIKRHR